MGHLGLGWIPKAPTNSQSIPFGCRKSVAGPPQTDSRHTKDAMGTLWDAQYGRCALPGLHFCLAELTLSVSRCIQSAPFGRESVWGPPQTNSRPNSKFRRPSGLPVVGVEGLPLHNQENNRAGMCSPDPLHLHNGANWNPSCYGHL